MFLAYVLGINIYSTHNFSRLPIPKNDESSSSRRKEGSTMQSIYRPGACAFHASRRFFLEIFVYPQLRPSLKNGVRVAIWGPRKRRANAESFVSPGKSRVGDVFAISNNSDEATIG